jgi:membrane protein required for colicin V production
MASGALGWVDVLILVILGGSVLVGVLRGLAFEVLSLLGWLVAWLCAQAWGIRVAQALHVGTPGSLLERGVGFALCFVAVLLGWKLLSWLVQQVIQATPLAPIDRTLGAAFGLLRGAVIVLVAVTLVGLTPWARSAPWQAATGVRWAQVLLGVLAPVMPGPGAPASGSGKT